MPAKPVIEPIELRDQQPILQFLRGQAAGVAPSSFPPAGFLDWLSQGSAVAGLDRPILGWKLVEGEAVRGVHLVTPFRQLDADGKPFHDLVSHNFYVEESCRGLPSLALFQRLLALRGQYRLKATTANLLSAKLWRAFRATPVATSETELCQMRLRGSLVVEAMARALRGTKPFLSRLVQPAGDFAERLDRVSQGLDGLETLSPGEAIDLAVSLARQRPGPRPEISEELLRWALSDPLFPRRLVVLRVNGRRTVAALAATQRGRWSQIPIVIIQAVWCEEAGGDPVALGLLHRACLRQAAVVSYGCDTRTLRLPKGVRRRWRGGPCRWLLTPAGLPTEDRWLGFDAV
jgi:hypothetical protein